MKKKVLSKKIRRNRIILLLILMLTSLTGLIWSYFTSLERTEEYIVYPYQHKSAVDYKVNLMDNQFFAKKTQPAEMAYITDLTDSIDTIFSYQFTGEGKATIDGEYSVVATLTATTGSEGHVVLERNDELIPPKEFSVEDDKLVLSENVSIPFKEYLDFTRRLRGETRFSPSELNLTVKYLVNLEVETEHGIIKEAIAPIMVIPLQDSTFVIGGSLVEEAEDGLKANRDVIIPLKYNARKILPFSTTILLAMLLYYLFMTYSNTEKMSLAAKEVFLIFKKHRDRIVSVVSDDFPTEKNKTVIVNSFIDLLRLAEELDKPIVYYQCSTLSGCKHSFLVISQGNYYVYDIEVKTVEIAEECTPWQQIKNESEVKV